MGQNPPDNGIGVTGRLGEGSESVGESGHKTSGVGESSSTSQSTWSGPETAAMEDETGANDTSSTSSTDATTSESGTASDEAQDQSDSDTEASAEDTSDTSATDSESSTETGDDTEGSTDTETESTEADTTDTSTDDETTETTEEDSSESSTTDTASETSDADTGTSETETTGGDCVPTWCIDDNAGQSASGDKILATAQHGIRIDIDRDMEIHQIDLYAGNNTPLDLTQNIRSHNDSGLIGDILATAAFPITTTPGYHPAVYDPPLQVAAGDVIWISWDALINMDAPVAISGTMRTFAWENPPGQWATFQRSSLLRVACCEL